MMDANVSNESSPIIHREKNKGGESSNKLSWTVYIPALCILGMLLMFSFASFKEQYISPASINLKSEIKDTENNKNYWSLYRHGYDPLEYFNSKAYLNYKFLSDYEGIIEPNARTQLMPSDSSVYKSYQSIHFTVCQIKSGSVSESCENGYYDIDNEKSSHFNVACDPFDEYEVEISGSSDGTTEEVLQTFTAVCMYVRREIRSLSESDLKSTLDAMATLWFTSEEIGQELYGNKFHNISYFTRAHYFGASHRNADHIHEGQGFLSQHLKLTNKFELAMQSVDNSVSLPYWDFTIDSETRDNYMFTEDTFGTLTSSQESSWTYRSDSVKDAKILDGRWKFLKVETGTPFPDVIQSNAYGFTRAPWNFNPSPFLSRFSSDTLSLPSCKNYHKWLKLYRLGDFLEAADTYPHTAAHDSIGGYYGCDAFDFMVEKGWIDDSADICFKWGTYMKDLWREHFVYPDSTGVFTCDETRLSSMMREFKSIAADYLNADDMTSKDWDCMQTYLCNGHSAKSFFGDQRESASCYDPSFWPIHPTLERGYHAKMLSGGFSEGTDWPEIACYRNTCFNESGIRGSHEECCFGHYEHDKFPNFHTGNINDEGVWMSNREYLDSSDPTSEDYDMPFIYDDFSWDHCDEDYDVDGLLKALYDGSYVYTDDSSSKTLAPTPSQGPKTQHPTASVDKTMRPTGSFIKTHNPTPLSVEDKPVMVHTSEPTLKPTKRSSPKPTRDSSDSDSTKSPSAVTRSANPTIHPTHSYAPVKSLAPTTAKHTLRPTQSPTTSPPTWEPTEPYTCEL